MMSRVRKYTAYLLVLNLTLLGWPGAGMTCNPGTGAANASVPALADAHAHHRRISAHDAAAGTDHSTHHEESGEQADQDRPLGCLCCDDCAAMCALSSCSMIAVFAASDVPWVNRAKLRPPPTDALPAGPAPHVLYRPPIVAV